MIFAPDFEQSAKPVSVGRKHFWFSAIPLTEPDENSDRWAIDYDFVSLTPLRLNLADDEWLERIQTQVLPKQL